jgi:hypothetical protein
MDFIKRHIVFFILIVLGVVSFVLFAVLYIMDLNELETIQASNANKQNRIAALLGRPGLAASSENTEAMEQYSAALEQQYNKLVSEMLREDLTSQLFANPPASNERFAIDHLGFREELRRLASERKAPERVILLDPGVSDFGFAEYSGVPPKPALVEDLYEQRKIIDFLVKELYKAAPAKLVSVKRGAVKNEVDTRPSTGGASRGERGMAVGSDSSKSNRGAILPKDVFEISEQISAQVPGIVDTIPIQIVFEGKTPSLRGFLNNIVESNYPILVRNVEVRPLLGQNRSATSSSSSTRPTTSRRSTRQAATTEKEENTDPDSIILPEGWDVVIADNRSEFTVTLEYLLPSGEKSSAQGE